MRQNIRNNPVYHVQLRQRKSGRFSGVQRTSRSALSVRRGRPAQDRHNRYVTALVEHVEENPVGPNSAAIARVGVGETDKIPSKRINAHAEDGCVDSFEVGVGQLIELLSCAFADADRPGVAGGRLGSAHRGVLHHGLLPPGRV